MTKVNGAKDNHYVNRKTAVNPPNVSIGLPVYNGENYLSEALDSILAQTYRDFEIIISDNASTDRTEEICRTYAAKDARIRYYRSESNRGAAWNFNRVYELSSGKYFKWAAHDDVLTPQFLEKCVVALETDPLSVLCFSDVQEIGPDGSETYVWKLRLRVDSPNPAVRFHDLLTKWHNCFYIFGLIRVSDVHSYFEMGDYANADRVLLARMALTGKFHMLRETLFLSRNHPQQSNKQFLSSRNDVHRLDWNAYAVWFNPEAKGRKAYPKLKMLYEHLRILLEAPLTGLEKMRCSLSVIAWMGNSWRFWTKFWLPAGSAKQPQAGNIS